MDYYLKPCPFCGQIPYIDKPEPNVFDYRHTPGYCVRCFECDLLFGYDIDWGGWFKTGAVVAAAWNRRDTSVSGSW